MILGGKSDWPPALVTLLTDDERGSRARLVIESRYGDTLRHIHTLFNVGTVGGLTDGQILEQFTTCPGEAAELAFAALVERHGPMVLRACQSVLREPHDAEHAFQATFLGLVRKAGATGHRDSESRAR
jgi:Sigma-70 region 2